MQHYKSDKWWKALRARQDHNKHRHTGVWLKNNKSYYFDLVVKGRRIRKGGYSSAEQAAIAWDVLIEELGLPHRKTYCESHYDYMVRKYGLLDKTCE